MESNGVKDALEAVFGKTRTLDQFGRDVRSYFRDRARPVLAMACLASAGLFWLAARWFGIPRHVGFEASLALQPHPAAVLLLVGFVLWVAVAVATAIAGTVRMDAGL